MAGGLFAVYRDTTALPPSHSSSRRTGTSINSGANIKKKDGLSVFRDNTPSGNGQLEKENLAPLNKGGKKVLSGGKGKKPVMSGKSDCGDSGGGNAVKPVAMGDRMVKKVQQPTTRPCNGVCTGTLRTRTLPPLPPLESEEVQIPLAPTAPLPPPVTEISRPRSPAPRNDLPRSAESPASNVDSGYGRVSELDRGFDDESDMSLEVESVEGNDEREGNRRARALTESPLAEITQAFTGLGRFSNINNNNFDNTPASPSPSQYISQRPKLPRTRSSPSKSVSALPPRLQPYSSLNATTKKLKPGQLAATAPKAAPSRSLRF